MFDVFLTACHLIITTECMTIENTRGPYEKRIDCLARMNEMSDDARAMFTRMKLPYVIVKRECRGPQAA
jgi:hypothetical protein